MMRDDDRPHNPGGSGIILKPSAADRDEEFRIMKMEKVRRGRASEGEEETPCIATDIGGGIQ